MSAWKGWQGEAWVKTVNCGINMPCDKGDKLMERQLRKSKLCEGKQSLSLPFHSLHSAVISLPHLIVLPSLVYPS